MNLLHGDGDQDRFLVGGGHVVAAATARGAS
jgi:hypothetical protein